MDNAPYTRLQFREELADAIVSANLEIMRPCLWDRSYSNPKYELLDLWLFAHREKLGMLADEIAFAFDYVSHQPAATEKKMEEALQHLRTIYESNTGDIRNFLMSLQPQYPHDVFVAIINKDALLTPALLHGNLRALSALRFA